LSNFEEEAPQDIGEVEGNAAKVTYSNNTFHFFLISNEIHLKLQLEVDSTKETFQEAEKILSAALEKHREAERRQREHESTISNYDEDSERITVSSRLLPRINPIVNICMLV